MQTPESWIDEQVTVKLYAEKEPLVGKLIEVNSRGIVLETENDMSEMYPKSEGIAVLAFLPMSKVSGILIIR